METRKFGTRLRELREQAGLSQRELADKVGVNFTYLSKIESGVMPPPSERVILRLAEVLDTDRDEFMILAGKVPSDIAQMLKNRENWQSLKSGHTREKTKSVNNEETFNTRLRELREQAGLSQRELADRVGVNFTYLSKIESGVMPPPSEKVILRLAEVLDADGDELMTLAGKVPSDIAQILKNRENWQFLRSGRTQEKVGVARVKRGNRGGINMMKYLAKYKTLSRVALAIVLVSAMAASLWFTSPLPVKALNVAITNPQGQPLISGTLGQTYYFQVKVTIENTELLPIQNIDLSMYNSANATYKATLTGLPLNNGGIANYTNTQTGGGGTANVTAATLNWNYIYSNNGSVTWNGTVYTFGYGYGFAGPASITYDVAWTPPAGWPGGSYRIDTKITAGGITFTQVSSGFTLAVGLVAETSISQAVDASDIVVVKVNIDRIKNPSDNATANITGGIGSYTARVSSTPDSGIRVLAVRGVSPFGNPTFDNVTGVFSVDNVTSPVQASNTTVAELVLRLTGNATTSYNLSVAFQSIGAAGGALQVSEEHSNTITFLRGDANKSGGVSMTDAMFAAQFYVRVKTVEQLNALNAASVRYDSTDGAGDKVSMTDAMFIAQYYVGLKDAYFIPK